MWKQFKYFFLPFLDEGNSRVFRLFSFFFAFSYSSSKSFILFFLFVWFAFHLKEWFFSVFFPLLFFVCVINTKFKIKTKRMEIGKVHTWKSMFKWICKVFQLMFMFVTQHKDVSIDVEENVCRNKTILIFFIMHLFSSHCLYRILSM